MDSLRNITDLYHQQIFGHIHDLGFHNFTQFHNLPAITLIVLYLDKHKLPADTGSLVEGFYFNDIQFFIELFFDLFDSTLIATADNRHAGGFRIIGFPHSKAVNIKASS